MGMRCLPRHAVSTAARPVTGSVAARRAGMGRIGCVVQLSGPGVGVPGLDCVSVYPGGETVCDICSQCWQAVSAVSRYPSMHGYPPLAILVGNPRFTCTIHTSRGHGPGLVDTPARQRPRRRNEAPRVPGPRTCGTGGATIDTGGGR